MIFLIANIDNHFYLISDKKGTAYIANNISDMNEFLNEAYFKDLNEISKHSYSEFFNLKIYNSNIDKVDEYLSKPLQLFHFSGDVGEIFGLKLLDTFKIEWETCKFL